MRFGFIVALLILGADGLGCAGSGVEETLFSGEAQGTTYSIKIAAARLSSAQKGEIEETFRRRFEGIDRAMSLYRPDSELTAFNRQQTTEPVRVSPELIEVFQAARAVSEASDGAFDVTVAPLVAVWGFGPSSGGAPTPTDAEIAELQQRVGFDNIEIDPAAGTLRKKRPDVVCDVNGIAQGYTVDKLAEDLRSLGYKDLVVEVGGEIRALGRNARGTPWRAGIEKPADGHGELQEVVSLDNLGLTTAGDYRNYTERNGVRLSHIIDPRTGRPVSHTLASVSVVDPRCVLADGYDTALMVLGPEKGYELAARKGIAALFIVRNAAQGFDVRTTPAFESRVHEQ